MTYLYKKGHRGYCSINNMLFLFLSVAIIKNPGIKILDAPTHTKVLCEGSIMGRHTCI
jgi:hypothetical protein